MKYKKLYNTQLVVSDIALGCDVYGCDVAKDDSYELLNTYIDKGGNVIDTALIYADWVAGEKSRSEKLIGEWMQEKKCRDDVIISTKGAHPNLCDMSKSRLSRKEILFDIECSLKNLRTDYIDIYWLHRDDENLCVGEIATTLDYIVKSGKSRYVGLSNWKSNRIDEINKYVSTNNLTPIVASQINYSIAKPNMDNMDKTLVIMDETQYFYYKSTKMNVFAFASQAKGIFSKMDIDITKVDGKSKERYFNDYNIEIYKKLKKYSQEYNVEISELVLYNLINNKDFVTIPIVGCKNTTQLSHTLNSCEIVIPNFSF